MKPYVITFDGDFLATQTLRNDGEGLVKDSREAMRFETDLDAEIYIENNREKLDKIGKNPTPIWAMPTGHVHH
ncbi:hypothetical protein PANO111632_15620 [Paracoccus nototheniae]|uniref:Uncharacterized protein n=1 Tax=Paracoccus nototheniae TaxID=2489002 RepID=A0ABW4E483_9RHOB|nr:hypothetical protein [Paracoccus nototheniae]